MNERFKKAPLGGLLVSRPETRRQLLIRVPIGHVHGTTQAPLLVCVCASSMLIEIWLTRRGHGD